VWAQVVSVVLGGTEVDALPVQVSVILVQPGIERCAEWVGRTKHGQHPTTAQRDDGPAV